MFIFMDGRQVPLSMKELKKTLENMSKELVKEGTTSYLPTTGTDSLEKINSQLVEGKKKLLTIIVLKRVQIF